MKNMLQENRWKNRWSQKELAERSGIGRSTIGEIENGQIKNPGIDTAYRLAKAMGMEVMELFYEEEG